MTAGLILLLLSSFMVTADHDCTKKDYLKSFHSTEESNCQRSGKPLVCMMPATSPSTAVMLYEPLTLLKPFHEEKRIFSVAGHTIHIHQKWEELGVSAVVWDAVSNSFYQGPRHFCVPSYISIQVLFSLRDRNVLRTLSTLQPRDCIHQKAEYLSETKNQMSFLN